MNVRIFIWSLTAALAGFLFGFDTVVISGAEKTIQSLWGLSPGLHGLAIASAVVLENVIGGEERKESATSVSKFSWVLR